MMSSEKTPSEANKAVAGSNPDPGGKIDDASRLPVFAFERGRRIG
jgi:hypothetical protein